MNEHTRYWWFGPEVVKELVSQLQAAGPDAKLRVIPRAGTIFLHVVDGEESAATVEEATATARFKPLNHANECPPNC